MKKRVIIGIFLLTLTLCGAVVATVAIIYSTQNVDANRLRTNGAGAVFFDVDGNVIERNQNQSASVGAMPEHIKWAFVCVEDKNFYKHKGVSYERIAKASVKNLNAKKTREGASTITQQLIKNTHLSSEKTFQRKIREAALAHKLEKNYTKDEILDMYLNIIYFGNGLNGLPNAARFYFDKLPQDLSVREAAGLAGILRSPANYDPINRPANFYERTNLVLRMMYDQGKITKTEYEDARIEEITITAKRRNNQSDAYVNLAMRQAEQILQMGEGEINMRNIRVYTFYDATAQNAIAEVTADPEYAIKNVSGTRADNMIIVATPNGEIRAVHTNNLLMPNARRNFASTLKPIAVYAPAVELGVVNPDTIIVDEPYVAGDFHPQNHDGVYHGEISVRQALAQSYNIPAVKILEYTTIPRAQEVATRLGLPLRDENLGLALGVTNNGVSAIELVGGFCALANGGNKTTPTFVSRIENAHGELLWEYQKPFLPAISTDTALTVTDMLRSVVLDGTAKKMGALDFDIAAKTGTAERKNTSAIGAPPTNTDAVNVSYTPNNVVLVWNGNADMKREHDLPHGTTGGGLTTFMARDIQRALNENCPEPYAKFAPPPTRETETPQILDEEFTIDPVFVDTAVGGTTGFNVRGRVSDQSVPTISFETFTGRRYEIYRTIGDTKSLLEAVKGTGDEYTYADTAAPQNKVLEYTVKCGEVESEKVKLYAANPISKTANPSKHGGGKHWFF